MASVFHVGDKFGEVRGGLQYLKNHVLKLGEMKT